MPNLFRRFGLLLVESGVDEVPRVPSSLTQRIQSAGRRDRWRFIPMISPSLIYLASPYSHPENYMKEARFILINRVAAKLMGEGKYIFSPISHTHPIALEGKLPGGWEYWEGYDRCMIGASDELLVLRLPGWETSAGVQAEIKIAESHSMPIKYIDYDLLPTIEDTIAEIKKRMDFNALSYDSFGKSSTD